MSAKPDGGPFHPCIQANLPTYGGHSGVSLRDWFAGQALVGLLANPDPTGTTISLSELSYEYADAMIAERAK